MMSDDYRFNSLSRFLLHRTCVNTMFNTCRFLLNGERQRCESQSRANRMISPEPGGPKWNGNENGKDLHTFVWSSSSSPVSEGGKHVFRGGADVGAHPKENDDFGQGKFSFGNKQGLRWDNHEGPVLSNLGSSSTAEHHPKSSGGRSRP